MRAARSWIAALTLAGLAGHVARAGGVDADLDLCRAELRPIPGGWSLVVRYEVELEDVCPPDEFDLALQLRECDRPVCDGRGAPLVLVVPLDRPVECDDDERAYRGTVGLRLPLEAVRYPDDLHLSGIVTFAGQRCPLDDDTVRVRPPRRHRVCE